MYYSLAAMLIFGTRVVVYGASIGDAIALAALCAGYAWSQLLETKKTIPANVAITDDVVLLKAEMEVLKSSVSALKVASTFKRVQER